MDLNDPDNLILEGKPIDHARALARAMLYAELEARQTIATRSSVITKIVRHRTRKAKSDLPALKPDEMLEFTEDIARLDSLVPSLGLAEMPLRQRADTWVSFRKLDRGKRGVAPEEVRPGIGATAFVFLNWRHSRGQTITARLDATFPKDGSIPKEAVAWTFWNRKTQTETERLYHPSEAVRWLASELCLLDPSLSGATPRGRRPDWHLAYDWTQRWREWRGMTKGSRR